MLLKSSWPAISSFDSKILFSVGLREFRLAGLRKHNLLFHVYLGVFKNRGTPKSSILIGVFPYKPSILGYPYFWKHPRVCYEKPSNIRWIPSISNIGQGFFAPQLQLEMSTSCARGPVLNSGRIQGDVFGKTEREESRTPNHPGAPNHQRFEESTSTRMYDNPGLDLKTCPRSLVVGNSFHSLILLEHLWHITVDCENYAWSFTHTGSWMNIMTLWKAHMVQSASFIKTQIPHVSLKNHLVTSITPCHDVCFWAFSPCDDFLRHRVFCVQTSELHLMMRFFMLAFHLLVCPVFVPLGLPARICLMVTTILMGSMCVWMVGLAVPMLSASWVRRNREMERW